jgi:hypothetical protein
MLSFHNDDSIKQKYLDRVRKHRELDNIIQGTGWEDGKGCAVGCTLENYDHSSYPIELGLPKWIAHLEDRIFEGLPGEEAMFWPEQFLSAIPVGMDVEPIKHQLAIRRMNRLIDLQTRNINDDNSGLLKQVIIAINAVKKCHETELLSNTCSIDWESASWAARSAASSAARSDSWAAWSAARSAASSAAWSAASSASWAAASSASWAARSAEYAYWKQEASDLLELLSQLTKE